MQFTLFIFRNCVLVITYIFCFNFSLWSSAVRPKTMKMLRGICILWSIFRDFINHLSIFIALQCVVHEIGTAISQRCALIEGIVATWFCKIFIIGFDNSSSNSSHCRINVDIVKRCCLLRKQIKAISSHLAINAEVGVHAGYCVIAWFCSWCECRYLRHQQCCDADCDCNDFHPSFHSFTSFLFVYDTYLLYKTIWKVFFWQKIAWFSSRSLI